MTKTGNVIEMPGSSVPSSNELSAEQLERLREYHKRAVSLSRTQFQLADQLLQAANGGVPMEELINFMVGLDVDLVDPTVIDPDSEMENALLVAKVFPPAVRAQFPLLCYPCFVQTARIQSDEERILVLTRYADRVRETLRLPAAA